MHCTWGCGTHVGDIETFLELSTHRVHSKFNQRPRAQTPPHECPNTRPRSKHPRHLWKFKTKWLVRGLGQIKRKKIPLARRHPPPKVSPRTENEATVSRGSRSVLLPSLTRVRACQGVFCFGRPPLPMGSGFFSKKKKAPCFFFFKKNMLSSVSGVHTNHLYCCQTTPGQTIIGTLDS